MHRTPMCFARSLKRAGEAQRLGSSMEPHSTRRNGTTRRQTSPPFCFLHLREERSRAPFIVSRTSLLLSSIATQWTPRRSLQPSSTKSPPWKMPRWDIFSKKKELEKNVFFSSPLHLNLCISKYPSRWSTHKLHPEVSLTWQPPMRSPRVNSSCTRSRSTSHWASLTVSMTVLTRPCTAPSKPRTVGAQNGNAMTSWRSWILTLRN